MKKREQFYEKNCNRCHGTGCVYGAYGDPPEECDCGDRFQPDEKSQESTTLTLRVLRIANVLRNQLLDPSNKICLLYRGNELAGETGEACNIIKKLDREQKGLAGARATPDQLAEELADIIIATDLAAMQAGIDLNDAIMQKFNSTSRKLSVDVKLVCNAKGHVYPQYL